MSQTTEQWGRRSRLAGQVVGVGLALVWLLPLLAIVAGLSYRLFVWVAGV
jgi:hypothetical protein